MDPVHGDRRGDDDAGGCAGDQPQDGEWPVQGEEPRESDGHTEWESDERSREPHRAWIALLGGLFLAEVDGDFCGRQQQFSCLLERLELGDRAPGIGVRVLAQRAKSRVDLIDGGVRPQAEATVLITQGGVSHLSVHVG